MEKRPSIAESIKRQIRQEAKFGCIFFGSPIVEYHHIEPYCKVKCHEKENLALLCPEHHHRANCGELLKEKVIEAKNNPFNVRVNFVRKEFCLNKYEDIKFELGGTVFRRCNTILQIDDEPIISVRPDENGYALFSAKFYDCNNILLAEIIDNEWIAYLGNEIWDIQYSPGKLKINNERNKIFLEIRIERDFFRLRTELYYKGHKVSFLPKETIVGNFHFKECLVEDCHGGFFLTTNQYN